MSTTAKRLHERYASEICRCCRRQRNAGPYTRQRFVIVEKTSPSACGFISEKSRSLGLTASCVFSLFKGSEGFKTYGVMAAATDLHLSVHHAAQRRCRALLQRHHPVPSVPMGTLGLHFERAGSQRPSVFPRSKQAYGCLGRASERSLHGKVLTFSPS